MTRTEQIKVRNWKERNGNLAYVTVLENRNGKEVPVTKPITMTDEEILLKIKALKKDPNKWRSNKNRNQNKGGRFFMADFETTTKEAMVKTGKDYTEVWAWAICPIPCDYEEKDCTTGTSLDSFMEWCRNNLGSDDVIFFHNLTFDGAFIMSWLLNHGYRQEKCGFKNKRTFNNFDLMASDMAGFYSLTVGFGKGAFRFQDSLKLLAFSVAEIGASFKTKNQKLLIDYDGHLEANIPLTAEEKKYVCNDILVVAQALWEALLSKGYTKMTAGANALEDFICRFGGKERFREFFPELSKEEDDFVRSAYRGAISQVKKGKEGKIIYAKRGKCADKHSMYPSQMHSKSGNRFPIKYGSWTDYGIKAGDTPQEILQKINDGISDDRRHYIRVKVDVSLKDEHMPFLQEKNNPRFRPNQFIEETEGMIEITMMDADYLLLLEQYDINAIEFVKAISYETAIGLFDEYIDYWYHIKETSSGALKQLAKLMLNSLYGKFATSLESVSLEAKIEDGVVKYEHVTKPKKPVYIPVGAAITSFARCDLVRSCQLNWENFLYCDTDSMHLTDIPIGIPITDHDICTWGYEGDTFHRCKYIRQKTYMEEYEDGSITVRCAGLPKSTLKRDENGNVVKVGVRELLNFDNFDKDYDFKQPGSPFIGCKLRRKTIKGGVILIPSDFEIRG